METGGVADAVMALVPAGNVDEAAKASGVVVK